MKILIIDDDTVSRLILAATLKSLGHEVVETKNGEEAWHLCQDEHFPLIISDWLMPDLDGLEFTRRVRSQQMKYSYIILLTALSGKANYLEAMDAGVDDFLTKPFDKEQLAARIRVAERILNLLTQVKTLSGLLPICSYCKRIRDEREYWEQVETYVMQRSDAQFSHGICPACYEEHVRPELEQMQRDAERHQK